MVQIHPSLPLRNTGSSRVLVARNPWQIGGAHLQPEHRLRFHHTPFGYGLIVRNMMDVEIHTFLKLLELDRFGYQVHVLVE